MDCCTNKWGKKVVLQICTQSPDGAPSCASVGFTTRTAKTSAQGSHVCGSVFFGEKLARSAYADQDVTIRVSKNGADLEVACWAGHSIQTGGLPTGAPGARYAVVGGAGELASVEVRKTAGWAEGGALASNVHVAVAVSSNAGPEGKVCCAQADCMTCPGGTTCTECEASKYLDPVTGTCVAPGPTGYRAAGAPWVAGRKCVPCAAMHCNDCTGVGTCTQCKDSKYLDATGACVDACPDGYYENGAGVTGRTCLACADASCTTCLGAGTSSCEDCTDSKFLHRGECLGTCPAGTFGEGLESPDGRECEACESDCKSCADGSVCETCENSKFLVDGDCVESCKAGFYGVGTGGTVGRTCVACEAHCASCTDGNTCVTCDGGRYLSNGDGVEECPAGRVAVGTGATGRVCEACATNCKRCSAPGVCTECENGKSLHGGTCVDDCTATTPAASLAAGSRRQASVGVVAFAVADPKYLIQKQNYWTLFKM